MLTLLPKGLKTKYLKLFWLKILAVHLELRIFQMALMGYWFMKKTWSQKFGDIIPLT